MHTMISFNLLQHHRSKSSGVALLCVRRAMHRGQSLLNVPLSKRQEILSRLSRRLKPAPIALSESLHASPTDLIRVAREFGFEGIIAERKDDKEEMKNCVWLKPELVAQVEFTEWTPDGHLRHSKFVGLREDKDARGIVREG